MSTKKVEDICLKKEQELLNKYFGNLVKEAAHERPETIGTYTKDLPLKIESEYKLFLEELWEEYAPDNLKGMPLVLEEYTRDLLMVMREDFLEEITGHHIKNKAFEDN